MGEADFGVGSLPRYVCPPLHWASQAKRCKKISVAQARCVHYDPRLAIPVLNEERRRAILDLLTHRGRVLVTELSRQFETSQVTIRKDLEILHAQGLVHRTHGGALPWREPQSKIQRCTKRKNSIVRKNYASRKVQSRK